MEASRRWEPPMGSASNTSGTITSWRMSTPAGRLVTLVSAAFLFKRLENLGWLMDFFESSVLSSSGSFLKPSDWLGLNGFLERVGLLGEFWFCWAGWKDGRGAGLLPGILLVCSGVGELTWKRCTIGKLTGSCFVVLDEEILNVSLKQHRLYRAQHMPGRSSTTLTSPVWTRGRQSCCEFGRYVSNGLCACLAVLPAINQKLNQASCASLLSINVLCILYSRYGMLF
ncbi:hypothetical protein E2C01_035649 [Portunus trituberculatus]|uniref:Uncharacterized protein n=1 Tax=Portunus trituberculatus TaxID=210409 RepID=A0A5B7F8X5_PORTR|nr:hypothetical protein [Portunus trituberculatus]